MTRALAERSDWERSFGVAGPPGPAGGTGTSGVRGQGRSPARANDFVRDAQWPEAIAAMTLGTSNTYLLKAT